MVTFFFFLIFSILLIICISILKRLTAIKNQMERFLSTEPQKVHQQPLEPRPKPTETAQPQVTQPLPEKTPTLPPLQSKPQPDRGAPLPSLVSTDKAFELKPFEQTEQPKHTVPASVPLNEIPPPVEKPRKTPEERKKQILAIELRVGIRWAIIVGSITLLVGLVFLLKSALAPFLSTAQGKITVITLVGMVALLIGEFTRRRNYDFCAKSLTALGFAILYTAVFSAYGYFGLIASTPSLALAVSITVAAMTYAVCLDEVVMAFLALFGGFLSPVLLSMNQNRPHALFVYVAILSLGAIGCSVFRKWRAVNILSFVGTFLLYSIWYIEHYTTRQMDVAISWLVVFFIIFLVVPVLYELVKKTVTQKEAAILVLSNALVVFVYLLAMLYEKHPQYLAAAAVIMAIAHFFMLLAVTSRCPADANLPPVLLCIALFCLTIAVPLYFEMYETVMVFAAKATLLALIAAKYRSKIIQIFSFIGLGLAALWLLAQLPTHTVSFRIILNTECLSWCAVAAAFYFFHLIHRQANSAKIEIINHPNLPIVFYLCFLGTLTLTAAMEWYYHLELNLKLAYGPEYLEYVFKAALVILTGTVTLLVARPFSPGGLLCKQLATIFAVAGTVLAPMALFHFHRSTFTIFTNFDFAIVLLFVLSLFAAAALLKRQQNEMPRSAYFSTIHALTGLFLLWILLTEEIYLYWCLLAQTVSDPLHYLFLGQMCISIMWAIYATGLVAAGLWRKISILRYISFVLYGLVLGKVFLFDMATRMSSIYRIGGFIVLGLALITVSFLYQFCKNKGLFGNIQLARETQKTDADQDESKGKMS
jgi:uncharacterized membrane protein